VTLECNNVTYSQCVSVALVIQHVQRMLPVILVSVDCSVLHSSSILSHKRHELRRNVTESAVCVLPPVHLSVKFLSPNSTQPDITIFSRRVFDNCRNIIFRKNPSNGSHVVPRGQTDGRTDIKDIMVAFPIVLHFDNTLSSPFCSEQPTLK